MSEINSLPFNVTPINPTLKDLLDQFGQDLMAKFSCHHIATIENFDPQKQTATAKITYQKTFFKLNTQTKKYEANLMPYPVLLDCPVVILNGGVTALTFPIQPGDECLVCFNDRDIDNWFGGNMNVGVATPRLHSSSDGIIIVGITSLPYNWDNYDTTRAVLRAGTISGSMAAVGVNPSGKVLITNQYPTNGVTLKTLLQQVCTDLNSLISALTTNATTFIAVTGAPTTPSPLNPAIVTALNTLSTSVSALSTQIGGVFE